MIKQIKLGDKVRLSRCRDCADWMVGAVGTVVDVDTEIGIYGVKFDDPAFQARMTEFLTGKPSIEAVTCFDNVIEAA
jgi:hypothetical protein